MNHSYRIYHNIVVIVTAQFFVHGRRSGVVALQNAMFPDKWLCLRDGKVTVVNTLLLYCVYIYTQVPRAGMYICYAQTMNLCNPWIVLRKVTILTLRKNPWIAQ